MNVFWSSLIDLHFLFSCRQGKMHFDTYFWFILFFNLTSWRQKYQIKYNRKLLFVSRSDILAVFRLNNCWRLASTHNFLNILTGWKNNRHTALGGVWKFWGYHCQNSALIMTNGIRKVRLEVDIFDKRILDSCKFTSASEYGLVYTNLFLAAGKV